MKTKKEILESIFRHLVSIGQIKNQQDIVDKIKGNKSNVSAAFNGNKKYLTDGLLKKINKSFDDIFSSSWIETGTGSMLNSESEPIINHEQRGVPYYDVDFIGGFDNVENSQLSEPTYFIDFKEYNNADYWVNVTGQSMHPLISHGDIISIRELKDWNTYILLGEIYAIVTDEYRTVKKVRKSERGDDFYKLVPINAEFDEQDIPKSIVRKVFQVQGTAKKIF